MKQNYLLFLIGCLCLSAHAQTVNIPDPYLKNALVNYSPVIDINDNNQIEVSEALLVTSLTLPAYQQPDVIENLTGLEAFTNLTYLDISKSSAYGTFNVSPLIHLEFLDCSEQYSLTVTGIESLSTLLHLNCSRTAVPGLANIATMANLQYLDCSFTTSLASLNVSNMTSLTYLDCSRCSLTSLNVSGSGLTTLYCANNNSLASLNLSSLTNQLTDLDCSYKTALSLTPGLGNITSLQHLNCAGMGLSSLNLTTLPNLITLNCRDNDLTTLSFANNQNLSELDCSQNSFTSLNFLPLINLTKLNCGTNQFTTININSLVNLTELSCHNNQISALNINQLVNLEVLDFSVNNVSAIDLSPFSQLKDLRCHINGLATLDISNATLLETLICYQNQLTVLNMSNNPKLASVDCEYNLFTSLDFSSFSVDSPYASAQYWFANNPLLEYVNLKHGQTAYISFPNPGNCPNLAYICADEQNINSINSSLAWGNLTNVQVNSYCTFNPGGTYNTLTGTIGIDTNGNGCDAADIHFPGIRVGISNGTSTSSTYTNSQGGYTFYLPAGNYTVTPQPEIPYYIHNPASAVINFPTDNGPVQTQSFCLSPNGIHHDLEIVLLPIQVAQPGFDATYRLIYRNKGTQTASGSATLSFNDNILDLVNANPASDSQALGLLTWNFTNLLPFESRVIDLTLNVNSPMESPAVNIGEVLLFNAMVNPVPDDETTTDNAFALHQTVVGSFDPNDKTCLEGTAMLPQMVGDYLHYVIRFQNSGTFAAQNIVVKDVIDTTKFDISTLQLTASSHSGITRITGNKVEFIFEGINLPAEETDEAGSHGFVAFKIKTKNNLVLGNSVTNIADIFFDFNFPIMTNPATTTVSLLGINQYENASVSVSPNPVKNILHISAKDDITSIQLFDIQGRLLQTKLENNHNSSLDLSGKTNGIYFLKVFTDKGMKVEKILRE
jgi:Leucine-rich repeat (LRR) protein